MPWLFNINNYNGWTPGFNFHHGYVPGYDYGIGIRPMWDFNNKKLIGTIKYKRTLYGFGDFYKSSINIDVTKNSGQSGVFIEFKGSRKGYLERYPIWSKIWKK